MAYKEIVVHVGPDERSAVRLDAAVELAERHEGKVTGIYVLSRLIVPGFASFELSTEVYKRLDTEQRALAEEAERQFAERMAKSTAPSEWRLTTGDPVDAVTTSAHYADIAVVGQTDPDDPDDANAERSSPGWQTAWSTTGRRSAAPSAQRPGTRWSGPTAISARSRPSPHAETVHARLA